MSSTTFSVKVPQKFAKEFRKFCERHFLQVGKFTEHALTEMMEDYHFGAKAQKALTLHEGKKVSHKVYFKD